MIPGYKIFGVLPLYYTFHAVAFIALFAFLVTQSKHYKIPKWKACVSTVVIYAASYAWMLFMYWASTGFKNFGGQNIVRIFVWVPIFVWITAKVMKINWRDLGDLVAPCLTLNHGIAHIACIFQGCCYGYECSWGVYNAVLDKRLFPIQILEALTALAITAYLYHLMRKKKYKTEGMLYPLMLILFGSTRFIWEFFRDNQKIAWGISGLAGHALLMTLVGIAWYAAYTNKKPKKKAS